MYFNITLWTEYCAHIAACKYSIRILTVAIVLCVWYLLDPIIHDIYEYMRKYDIERGSLL